MTTADRRRVWIRRATAWGAALYGAWLFYQTAWLCDDAYITLRTVDNVLDGHGMRWNVSERVQSFTHPLWLLLLLAVIGLTGDVYFTSMYVGIALSVGLVIGTVWTAPNAMRSLVAVSFILLSKSVVDFSTSGLEDPLTHVLCLALVVLVVSPAQLRHRFALCALCGCALMLNRLDHALIVVPAIAIVFPKDEWRRGLGTLLLALLPFALWEAFSFFYYGFFVPNTAYAKLALGGKPFGEHFLMGVDYLLATLRWDPVVGVAILWALVEAGWRRDGKRLALLGGALAYLVYVMSIGGDHMVGRLVSAPTLIAILCLATAKGPRRARTRSGEATLAAVCFVLVGLSPRWPFTEPDARAHRRVGDRLADERAHFYRINSLAHADAMQPDNPAHPWASYGRQLSRRSGDVVYVTAMGLAGYYAGPQIHLVDCWALGDPLLARLPAIAGERGHLTRGLPEGYLRTLRTGEPHMTHPGLNHYHQLLREVVSGPLWSFRRLRLAWELNLGVHDHLIAEAVFERTARFVRTIWIDPPGHRKVVGVHVGSTGCDGFSLPVPADGTSALELGLSLTAQGVDVEANGERGQAVLAPRGVVDVTVQLDEPPHPRSLRAYGITFRYAAMGQDVEVLRIPLIVRILGGDLHFGPVAAVQLLDPM